MKFLFKTTLLIAFLSFYFLARPLDLKAEITTDGELNNFITYYYLNPRPSEVPQALRYFLTSTSLSESKKNDGHLFDLMSYFFGRLAEINPNLLREYEKFYDSADEVGKLFLLSVFRVYNDEKVENFLKEKLGVASQQVRPIIQEILSKPPLGRKSFLRDVKNYNQLDFLWFDFFITGDKEPIIKLINVLTWEDKFREKLTVWMFTKHPIGEIRKLENLLKEVGVEVDLKNRLIIYPGDIDCMYSAYIQSSGFVHERSKAGVKIRKILNFSEQDMIYMATKGAAMWALQSNAQQHPKVLDFCKEELNSRTDKSRIELAVIVELASKHQPGKNTLRDSFSSF